MKTKIRIQESDAFAISMSNDKFKHYCIQILTERYKSSRYLEPIGQISFQMTVAEPQNEWYGMRFIIDTDKAKYIQKMATLAKIIKTNRSGYSAQPKEIIELIGGVEHVHFNSEFIPVTDKGKNIYKVMSESGNFIDTVIAQNEDVANNILRKRSIEAKLIFDKQINF